MADAPLRYHWIRLRTTCHATEDPAKVDAAVRTVSGLEEDEFGTGLKVTPLESHHGALVQVVECTIERSRAVRDVLGRLFDLPGVRQQLAETIEARTDDDGIFYVRLDKQEAAQGRLVLTQGEDAVQLRLKLETYPATREAAMAGLMRLFAQSRP